MSRQMTRLLFRLERNFRFSLLRWVFSMTKMMSAHSTCSEDNNTSAPFEMPAEAVSIPGQVRKDLFRGRGAEVVGGRQKRRWSLCRSRRTTGESPSDQAV